MECTQNAYSCVTRKSGDIMKRWQTVILVLTLNGCAISSEQVADESLGAPEKVCVNVRNTTSFDVIDDKHIYIKARDQQKHFLFTMLVVQQAEKESSILSI